MGAEGQPGAEAVLGPAVVADRAAAVLPLPT